LIDKFNIIVVNIFKKIKLFLLYRSITKSISKELEIEYNTRIDSILRMYSVLNIPENIFEEPYNLRRTDIDTIARNYITEYRKNLSTFLISRGLMELFDVYEVRKVDKYSYLLIFGFSLFNTRKLANSLIISSIVISFFLIIAIITWISIKTLS